jgi:uncharacterized protein YndB with AHSA1/START domain
MTHSTDSADLGTYIEHEGRPALRFVRIYPHPVERLWRAITDPNELARWFPARATLEQRVGGSITFSFAEDVKESAGVDDSTGTVLVCDPPRQLAYTWEGDELHFELEPLPDNHCRLTFISVLHRRDAAARDGAGWTVCLAELDRMLGGAPGGGPHSAGALDWKPIYERYVAAGVPSGAPIPGVS